MVCLHLNKQADTAKSDHLVVMDSRIEQWFTMAIISPRGQMSTNTNRKIKRSGRLDITNQGKRQQYQRNPSLIASYKLRHPLVSTRFRKPVQGKCGGSPEDSICWSQVPSERFRPARGKLEKPPILQRSRTNALLQAARANIRIVLQRANLKSKLLRSFRYSSPSVTAMNQWEISPWHSFLCESPKIGCAAATDLRADCGSRMLLTNKAENSANRRSISAEITQSPDDAVDSSDSARLEEQAHVQGYGSPTALMFLHSDRLYTAPSKSVRFSLVKICHQNLLPKCQRKRPGQTGSRGEARNKHLFGDGPVDSKLMANPVAFVDSCSHKRVPTHLATTPLCILRSNVADASTIDKNDARGKASLTRTDHPTYAESSLPLSLVNDKSAAVNSKLKREQQKEYSSTSKTTAKLPQPPVFTTGDSRSEDSRRIFTKNLKLPNYSSTPSKLDSLIVHSVVTGGPEDYRHETSKAIPKHATYAGSITLVVDNPGAQFTHQRVRKIPCLDADLARYHRQVLSRCQSFAILHSNLIRQQLSLSSRNSHSKPQLLVRPKPVLRLSGASHLHTNP
ncbi:hypothetical protein CLF_107063 [Clonorchis sinensis]|uniref:Uncharacterized protein n=1 Tax=Clonorchis sinensis TaxID=79923 RepID=G7YG38_CLOSI|nr:hypothetical protein CLF_107063 [Clonorchis sinensis]